jgi:hypothetical protein
MIALAGNDKVAEPLDITTIFDVQSTPFKYTFKVVPVRVATT